MFQLQRMMSMQQRKRSDRPLVQQARYVDDSISHKRGQNHQLHLNNLLQRIGKEWNLEVLKKNRHDASFFRHGRFLIIVEALDKPSPSVFVKTRLLRYPVISASIMRKALELNYRTLETRGCTLALKPICEDEDKFHVSLCYSYPIEGLTQDKLSKILENFMDAASSLHQKLSTHRSSPCVDKLTGGSKRLPRRESRMSPPSIQKHTKPTTFGSVTKLQRRSSIMPWVPPPPPEDADATPVISNKSVGKRIFIDPPSDLSKDLRMPTKRIQSIQPTKTSTTTGETLGLISSTYSGEREAMTTKKRSKVIGRLARMVSLTPPRPFRARRIPSRPNYLRANHATEIVLN